MVSARFNTWRPRLLPAVLNALRHQWFRHGHILGLLLPDLELCSTPYGINGFGTVESSSGPRYCQSAQRLTASMVSAPATRRCNGKIGLCSTPYGINGFGTEQSRTVQKLTVGAQRLTASMVSALGQFFLINRDEVCSTPYGINGFGT